MEQQTTNQVRQILMNELGLTRETVREEMLKIIEKTIEKFINSDRLKKSIDERIESAFQTYLHSNNGRENLSKQLRTEIVNVARKEAAIHFGQNYHVQIISKKGEETDDSSHR